MAHSLTLIVVPVAPEHARISRLRVLVQSGLDAVYLPSAQYSFEENRKVITSVQTVAQECKQRIPVIADLSLETKAIEGMDALPPIGEHNQELFDFCLEQEVEYIALPFAYEDDIEEIRTRCNATEQPPKILAKIESKEALRNIKSITEHADAILLDRIKLAQAIQYEQLPFTLHQAIQFARFARTPSIIFGNILVSLRKNETPSADDVADLAHLVLSNADGFVLDEEGFNKNPLEALRVAERIIVEAERHVQTDTHHL